MRKKLCARLKIVIFLKVNSVIDKYTCFNRLFSAFSLPESSFNLISSRGGIITINGRKRTKCRGLTKFFRYQFFRHFGRFFQIQAYFNLLKICLALKTGCVVIILLILNKVWNEEREDAMYFLIDFQR